MSIQESGIVSRELVLELARSWIGTPYIHQASVKTIGCDCLGLLRGIWRELYTHEPENIPNYSADWGESKGREFLREAAEKHLVPVQATKAKPADVILFRWNENSIIKHVGIISGKNRFIHSYEKSGVVESSLGRDWACKVAGFYSFPGLVS